METQNQNPAAPIEAPQNPELIPITPEELRNMDSGPDALLESIVFTDQGAFRKSYTQADVDRAAATKARELAGEIKLTLAEERLNRLRGARGAQMPIERHEILGEEWFTQRANFEGINRIMVMTPRDKKGALIMFAEGVLSSLLTAMIFVCCVKGEADETPLFEKWEHAHAFATDRDPAVIETCNALFSAILKQTPEIWPEGKEQLDLAEEEEKGDIPLASTPLPFEMPNDGLPAAASTEQP